MLVLSVSNGRKSFREVVCGNSERKPQAKAVARHYHYYNFINYCNIYHESKKESPKNFLAILRT